MELETIRIYTETRNQRGQYFVVINKCDFDPEKHVEYDPTDPEKLARLSGGQKKEIQEPEASEPAPEETPKKKKWKR